ncbi:glycosyl transferase [Spirosoma sp. RP8]|uniref:Glycosyl transferase n=1 Tax=Spirosoma liriopis TaxID=2937440 RepID=A0ABT0HFI3_9BACT|nr:glycosyl transferase [Spirosoma liriopis]MCK8490931.1 glycosyl transferase [Spirosoma liriopis]
MTLAFTICSINYLAQARTLGDSLKETNPDYTYVIGLVDKLSVANLPAELMPEYAMLEVDKIGIPDFAAMCDRYDITELNTAVKPFYIDYFFKNNPDVTQLIYFDPDIIIYQPLHKLNQALQQHSLVLTPHTCSPTPDWERPNEIHHLGTGIFNLGFIGLRKDQTAQEFVDWWKERLVYECRIDLCNGLFVDQHWVNFAPVYYDNVLIDRHVGYNVAYWNLHERYFSQDSGGQWRVNDTELLQFFHYSGYNPYRPNDVSKYQTRFTFDPVEIPGQERPDVKPLFDIYRNRLLKNHNDIYQKYPCVYIKPPKVLRYKRVRKVLNTPFTRLISLLETH